MKEAQLKIGTVKIDVTFKDIKNLHLSVHPPYGRVTISSPEFYDLEKVQIYAATKLAWIKKEQDKIRSQEREGEKLFITRESHQFLGKRFLLNVIEARRPKIVLRHSDIDLYARADATTVQKQKTLYNWYKRQLQTVVAKLLIEHATSMGLSDFDYGIRKSKTKWGSCATDSRKLWFNVELAKKPIECIEYIVVHELVHLVERNHNKRFVLLMDKFLPNWRVQKKILNELPI